MILKPKTQRKRVSVYVNTYPFRQNREPLYLTGCQIVPISSGPRHPLPAYSQHNTPRPQTSEHTSVVARRWGIREGRLSSYKQRVAYLVQFKLLMSVTR